MGVTRTGTTGGSGARGSKRPIAGAEDIIAQCRGLKGVRAVKNSKKKIFNFLRVEPLNRGLRGQRPLIFGAAFQSGKN
jgi:hypothetical protein